MSATTDATLNLLAGTLRGWRGTQAFAPAARRPEKLLELPYVLRNTGKGVWTDMGPPSFRDRLFKAPKETTRNRAWLAEHAGKVQVPYLVDPNTRIALYESDTILAYLDQTYAVPPA
jgi:glutathione S-transferase